MQYGTHRNPYGPNAVFHRNYPGQHSPQQLTQMGYHANPYRPRRSRRPDVLEYEEYEEEGDDLGASMDMLSAYELNPRGVAWGRRAQQGYHANPGHPYGDDCPDCGKPYEQGWHGYCDCEEGSFSAELDEISARSNPQASRESIHRELDLILKNLYRRGASVENVRRRLRRLAESTGEGLGSQLRHAAESGRYDMKRIVRRLHGMYGSASHFSSNPRFHAGGGMRRGGRYYPGGGRGHHSGGYHAGGGHHYGGAYYPGGGHYEHNPGRHITHSGVAPCPCCNEDIMVDDIRRPSLCEECAEYGCDGRGPCMADGHLHANPPYYDRNPGPLAPAYGYGHLPYFSPPGPALAAAWAMNPRMSMSFEHQERFSRIMCGTARDLRRKLMQALNIMNTGQRTKFFRGE